jgi:iron complex outermembrane receptor protein
VDLSFIPTPFLSRIEVLRGAASAAFGTGAMGGVVNLVTRDPGSGKGWARLSGGSFGSWLGSGGVSASLGEADVLVAASGLTTSGDFSFVDDRQTPFNPFDDRLRTRRNNWARSGGLLFKSQARLPGGGKLRFTHQVGAQTRGVAGLLGFVAEHARESTWEGLVDVRTCLPWDAAVLELAGRVLASGHRLSDPGGELVGVPLDSNQESGQVGLEGQVLIPWGEDGSLRLRVEVTRLNLRDPSFANPARLGAALTGLGDLVLAKGFLSLAPVVRLAWHSDLGASLVPGVGVGLTLWRNLKVKANLALAYRAPGFDELYLRGGFAEGNPDLRPERALGVDLGFDLGPLAGWRVLLAGYYQRYQDLIIFEPAAAFRYRPQNTGAADAGGVELEVSGSPVRWLDAGAQASVLLSADRSGRTNRDGNRIAGWPLFQAGVWVEGHPGRMLFEAGLIAVGENYVNAANTKSLPARVLLNAGVGVDAGEGVTVLVQGKNLLDSQVEDVRGSPLPGVSFFLTVSFAQGGAR